ncbi:MULTISPECIES: SPJ_0845 family protein [unclassified Streptococcus]|nr:MULTISPECIES: SPJ_0845 family protein [unclassified Streptococcus]
MAVTFKRQDDLEKMLEEFASFDQLESIDFPDKAADKTPAKPAEKSVESK